MLLKVIQSVFNSTPSSALMALGSIAEATEGFIGTTRAQAPRCLPSALCRPVRDFHRWRRVDELPTQFDKVITLQSAIRRPSLIGARVGRIGLHRSVFGPAFEFRSNLAWKIYLKLANILPNEVAYPSRVKLRHGSMLTLKHQARNTSNERWRYAFRVLVPRRQPISN